MGLQRIDTSNKKLILLQIFLLVGAVAIISFLSPAEKRTPYNYSIGEKWQYSTLIAPRDMSLYDKVRRQAIIDTVHKRHIPIYKYNQEFVSKQLQGVNEALNNAGAPSSLVLTIVKELNRLYTDCGIVDQSTYEAIQSGNLPKARVYRNNELTIMPTSTALTGMQAYLHLDSLAKASHPDGHTYMVKASVNDYVNPNVELDKETNDKVLKESEEQALNADIKVLKDDPIVRRGDVISAEVYKLIKQYEDIQKQKAENSKITIKSVGHWAVIALLLLTLYGFLATFRYRIFNDARKLTFIMTTIVAFTGAVIFIMSSFRSGIYIAPFAIIPIIVATFFDSRTGIFAHFVQVLICATIVVDNSLDFIIMQFIVGLVTIITIQELSKRSQLVGCALWVSITYSVTYIALSARHGVLITGGADAYKFLYFFINGLFLSFCYMIIFVVERIFGFTSTVTMVELTDINNPLLRKLSESCPGTFQHSMQVASIAAEAAHKIGANVQLVRAGALYHDIGKIKSPNFFTENQRGVNPHDLLTPQQSAEIVIRHVSDGLKLADKEKLPQVIKDFIEQHHGCGLTRYFYTQACNQNPGVEIDPEPFTYPGPNPQTREAAILMMADATEAASKSITTYTTEALSALVEKIINGQIADGLLRDAPISFRDVELIKRTFIERLAAFYHMRVAYPEAIKPVIQKKVEEEEEVPVDEHQPND